MKYTKIILIAILVLFVLDLSLKRIFITQTDFDQSFVTMIISLLLIVMFIFMVKIKEYRLKLLSILLGGISNLFDRLAYGGVIDYLHLSIFQYRINFNIADIMIILGVFWNAFTLFRNK